MTNFVSKETIISIKIKQQYLLSDISENISDFFCLFKTSKNQGMFRPLQGVDSSISIGRIERRYESLQTYDTNVFYI